MTGDGTLTPQVCPTATTTYTLTAYEAGGCFDTDEVTITVGAPFTVSLTLLTKLVTEVGMDLLQQQ